MNLGVAVLHNVAQSFLSFDPVAHDLHHAHTFQVVADSVNEAARLVFELGNVGPGDLPAHLSFYAPQVTEYRQRMNRSLSVGDVLVIVDLDREDFPTVGVMACESVGWSGLEYVPDHESGSNLEPISKSYQAYSREWDTQTHN